jgi:hypothetical protein
MVNDCDCPNAFAREIWCNASNQAARPDTNDVGTGIALLIEPRNSLMPFESALHRLTDQLD